MFDVNNDVRIAPKIQSRPLNPQPFRGCKALHEETKKHAVHDGKTLIVKQRNGVVREHRTLSPEEFRDRLAERLQTIVEQQKAAHED